jgi:hypothetical protein
VTMATRPAADLGVCVIIGAPYNLK